MAVNCALILVISLCLSVTFQYQVFSPLPGISYSLLSAALEMKGYKEDSAILSHH